MDGNRRKFEIQIWKRKEEVGESSLAMRPTIVIAHQTWPRQTIRSLAGRGGENLSSSHLADF